MASRDTSDHLWDTSAQITSTGSANAYVLATAQPITGYYQGMPDIRFKANFTNSGSATFNVNTLGAVTGKKYAGATNLASGDIVSGGVYTLIHDGTNFQVLELNAPAVAAYSPTAGGGIDITGTTFATTIKRRSISDITSGGTVTTADRATRVRILSGTGTLALEPLATLTNGFWCIIQNLGTGNVTLDPDSAETIDGLTSWVLYPGGGILVTVTASDITSVLLSPMQVTFDASGTFVKPGCGTWADIEAWGGGGSGARGTGDTGGGGGGAYNRATLPLTAMSATPAVTIGAGGVARSSDSDGASGGTTSFALSSGAVTAFGGGGGDNAGNGGGGGGGKLSGGSIPTGAGGGAPGSPNISLTGTTLQGQGGDASGTAAGQVADQHGGGGGDAGAGGASVHGGGGGGGCNATTASAGGTSSFGGAGGAAAVNGANATAGTQPGGGGGASEGVSTGISGAGGAGRVIVRVC